MQAPQKSVMMHQRKNLGARIADSLMEVNWHKKRLEGTLQEASDYTWAAGLPRPSTQSASRSKAIVPSETSETPCQ